MNVINWGGGGTSSSGQSGIESIEFDGNEYKAIIHLSDGTTKEVELQKVKEDILEKRFNNMTIYKNKLLFQFGRYNYTLDIRPIVRNMKLSADKIKGIKVQLPDTPETGFLKYDEDKGEFVLEKLIMPKPQEPDVVIQTNVIEKKADFTREDIVQLLQDRLVEIKETGMLSVPKRYILIEENKLAPINDGVFKLELTVDLTNQRLGLNNGQALQITDNGVYIYSKNFVIVNKETGEISNTNINWDKSGGGVATPNGLRVMLANEKIYDVEEDTMRVSEIQDMNFGYNYFHPVHFNAIGTKVIAQVENSTGRYFTEKIIELADNGLFADKGGTYHWIVSESNVFMSISARGKNYVAGWETTKIRVIYDFGENFTNKQYYITHTAQPALSDDALVLVVGYKNLIQIYTRKTKDENFKKEYEFGVDGGKQVYAIAIDSKNQKLWILTKDFYLYKYSIENSPARLCMVSKRKKQDMILKINNENQEINLTKIENMSRDELNRTGQEELRYFIEDATEAAGDIYSVDFVSGTKQKVLANNGTSREVIKTNGNYMFVDDTMYDITDLGNIQQLNIFTDDGENVLLNRKDEIYVHDNGDITFTGVNSSNEVVSTKYIKQSDNTYVKDDSSVLTSSAETNHILTYDDRRLTVGWTNSDSVSTLSVKDEVTGDAGTIDIQGNISNPRLINRTTLQFFESGEGKIVTLCVEYVPTMKEVTRYVSSTRELQLTKPYEEARYTAETISISRINSDTEIEVLSLVPN